MWEPPHKEHWEIPTRNKADRDMRRERFPDVDPEDWGETYWRKRMAKKEALLTRTQGWRYGNNQLEKYETHGPVSFISIISLDEWYAEHITPVVNAEDQMLQVLAAGVQGEVNDAGRWSEQSSNTEEEQWGNQHSTGRWSNEEEYGEIQWLRGQTVQKFVQSQDRDHQCFIWIHMATSAGQCVPGNGHPWYLERGWDDQWRRLERSSASEV